MSNSFKLDIVNPEKSFLSKEDAIEVVVPAFEGDMGFLKAVSYTHLTLPTSDLV